MADFSVTNFPAKFSSADYTYYIRIKHKKTDAYNKKEQDFSHSFKNTWFLIVLCHPTQPF